MGTKNAQENEKILIGNEYCTIDEAEFIKRQTLDRVNEIVDKALRNSIFAIFDNEIRLATVKRTHHVNLTMIKLQLQPKLKQLNINIK